MQRFVVALAASAAAGAHKVQVAGVDTRLPGPLGGGHGAGGHFAGGSPNAYPNLRPLVKIGAIPVKGSLDKAIVRR